MGKILFLSSTNDVSMGSYRIWVHDLNLTFLECGFESKISHQLNREEIEAHDIIICAKPDVNVSAMVKAEFPHKKVGIINLNSDVIGMPIDFVIVGSLEEAASLAHYENVFLYPLIERMYQSKEDYKTHHNKDELVLGFHGHYPHLSKFAPYLKPALEELDQTINLQLKIITSNVNFNWKIGKPKIKNLSMVEWNLRTIKEELMKCDVGIVPNITTLSLENLELQKSTELGLNKTDHVIRMKNKSNAGRAFVFHQLGIPVVADLTPSNFHILGDPRCGFIAFNKDSWIKSILKLADSKKRQSIAKAAKEEFDRLYDPHVWAKRLHHNILRG